jgi:selenocysteine lyase/cysteine desulfurase
LPSEAAHLSRILESRHIVATIRADEVRASLGLYTNEEDIDQFVDALAAAQN